MSRPDPLLPVVSSRADLGKAVLLLVAPCKSEILDREAKSDTVSTWIQSAGSSFMHDNCQRIASPERLGNNGAKLIGRIWPDNSIAMTTNTACLRGTTF